MNIKMQDEDFILNNKHLFPPIVIKDLSITSQEKIAKISKFDFSISFILEKYILPFIIGDQNKLDYKKHMKNKYKKEPFENKTIEFFINEEKILNNGLCKNTSIEMLLQEINSEWLFECSRNWR